MSRPHKFSIVHLFLACCHVHASEIHMSDRPGTLFRSLDALLIPNPRYCFASGHKPSHSKASTDISNPEPFDCFPPRKSIFSITCAPRENDQPFVPDMFPWFCLFSCILFLWIIHPFFHGLLQGVSFNAIGSSPNSHTKMMTSAELCFRSFLRRASIFPRIS